MTIDLVFVLLLSVVRRSRNGVNLCFCLVQSLFENQIRTKNNRREQIFVHQDLAGELSHMFDQPWHNSTS